MIWSISAIGSTLNFNYCGPTRLILAVTQLRVSGLHCYNEQTDRLTKTRTRRQTRRHRAFCVNWQQPWPDHDPTWPTFTTIKTATTNLVILSNDNSDDDDDSVSMVISGVILIFLSRRHTTIVGRVTSDHIFTVWHLAIQHKARL